MVDEVLVQDVSITRTRRLREQELVETVRQTVLEHGAVLLKGWHLSRRSVCPADVTSVSSKWVLGYRIRGWARRFWAGGAGVGERMRKWSPALTRTY